MTFNSPEIVCKTDNLKVTNMTQLLFMKGLMEIARAGTAMLRKMSRAILGSVREELAGT